MFFGESTNQIRFGLSTILRFTLVDATRATETGMAVRLWYFPRDPYAITATFVLNGHETITWMLSRELLTRGLRTVVGDGDVHMRPDAHDASVVWIELKLGPMAAVFRAPADGVAEYLTRTYRLVPVGEESHWLDLDRVIQHLLDGAA